MSSSEFDDALPCSDWSYCQTGQPQQPIKLAINCPIFKCHLLTSAGEPSWPIAPFAIAAVVSPVPHPKSSMLSKKFFIRLYWPKFLPLLRSKTRVDFHIIIDSSPIYIKMSFIWFGVLIRIYKIHFSSKWLNLSKNWRVLINDTPTFEQFHFTVCWPQIYKD